MSTIDSPSSELLATARFIAPLWLAEAPRELLDQLAIPPLSIHWQACGGWVPDRVDEDTTEDLATQFCRLFLGPRDHLPPYQSVWTEERFQGNATASTRLFQTLMENDAPPLPPGVPADHLGYQLQLWAAMQEQAMLDGRREGKPQGPITWDTVCAEFARRHLQWADPLFDAVERRAPGEFYRGLSRVTRHLIRELSP